MLFKKSIVKKSIDVFLTAMEKIEYGKFDFERADGTICHFEGSKPGPHCHLKCHDDAVIYNMALRGDVAFAEDYCLGKWESRDIAALVECAMMNEEYASQYISGSWLKKIIANISYLLKQNTKSGSKKNIQAHYDLGNDFYALWLDKTMTYSSGIFATDKDDLVDSQHNKYDRILELLGNSSKNILEVGCGWGGFAERGIEQSDHRIKGITISPSQCAYATKRLKDKKNQVAIQMQDYRDLKGKYQGIVSIEMFEAVGERYWSTYFGKLKSLLDKKGNAVIQTITIADKYFDSYRRGSDVIRSYIFPGGMLPSPEKFEAQANKAGLQLTDKYFFGKDYARTLRYWLVRFEEQQQKIRDQGFDESFIRLWRFYLTSCIGAFSASRINVAQFELHHA